MTGVGFFEGGDFADSNDWASGFCFVAEHTSNLV